MFVFVIYNKVTKKLVNVLFDEDKCINQFKILDYECSDTYDWIALNLG